MFKFLFTPLKAFFANIKFYLIVFVVLAICGGFAWMYFKNNSLQHHLAQVQHDKDVAEKNLAVTKNANDENQKTIQRLIKEKKDAEIALSQYKQNYLDKTKKVEDLRAYIRSIKSGEDGPIAPVLKNTLEKLQSYDSNGDKK